LSLPWFPFQLSGQIDEWAAYTDLTEIGEEEFTKEEDYTSCFLYLDHFIFIKPADINYSFPLLRLIPMNV
jgi:hypothetical protein